MFPSNDGIADQVAPHRESRPVLETPPDDKAREANSTNRPLALYVINAAWFFALHRLHLAVAARDAGFEMHVAAAPVSEDHVQKIESSGLVFHKLDLRRGGWSLMEECRLTWNLYKLYKELRPAVVHHVTIKPILFGTFAARCAGVPRIVNSFSGLGYVFTAADRWARLRRGIVKFIYRAVFSDRRVRIIFENSDDQRMFQAEGIVTPGQGALIRGVGVDPQRFKSNVVRNAVPLVILPARMLWDKGVREFTQAAEFLRKEGVNARFALVGGLDQENPAAIPESWLKQWQQSGAAVEWWGFRADMAPIYSQADIVCLPSYREGLPTVLLEGGASRCALVTTDVPGCREVVQDGVTGLLVPPRDPLALSSALRKVIEDHAFRQALSDGAHQYVLHNFAASDVERRTIELYRS